MNDMQKKMYRRIAEMAGALRADDVDNTTREAVKLLNDILDLIDAGDLCIFNREEDHA